MAFSVILESFFSFRGCLCFIKGYVRGGLKGYDKEEFVGFLLSLLLGKVDDFLLLCGRGDTIRVV